MSEFWLGAMVALAVYQFLNILVGLILYGEQTTINLSTIGVEFGLMCIFMAAAWYIAVF